MAHDEQWLTPRLQTAATLCNQTPAATESPLWLGWIWAPAMWCRWLSTRRSASGGMPRLGRCGSRRHRLGFLRRCHHCSSPSRHARAAIRSSFSHAATSFPPGTDPRISINVLESAGLEVSHVLDEPTAVADLLQLDNAGVVDIGGGTTGIAIVKRAR